MYAYGTDILDIDDIEEWRTRFCRFNGDGTKREGTLRSYKSSHGPLQECELKVFVLKSRELVKWTCVP